jgi:hypothetical protein
MATEATTSGLQSLTSTTLTTSLPSTTASDIPLTILVRGSIEGTSDFFPFLDIAGLGTGSDDVDSGLTFKELFATNLNGGQEIILFSSGCHIDGVADCTNACSNSSLFFSSLETFYNCAALAAAAHWTQDAKSYYISQETERNASAVMGSGTLANFDGRPVLKSLIACAQDACENDGLSKPCNRTIDRLSYETSSPEEIFEALDEFCPELPAEVNPDIFGPGVSPNISLFCLLHANTGFSRFSSHTSFKYALLHRCIFSSKALLSGSLSRKTPVVVNRSPSLIV